MLKQILDALPYARLNKSELIDIAKGKYKIPMNFKELKNQIKWQSKR